MTILDPRSNIDGSVASKAINPRAEMDELFRRNGMAPEYQRMQAMRAKLKDGYPMLTFARLFSAETLRHECVHRMFKNVVFILGLHIVLRKWLGPGRRVGWAMYRLALITPIFQMAIAERDYVMESVGLIMALAMFVECVQELWRH